MQNTKIILLAVLCFISGVIFLFVGLKFLSKKFLEKLNESSAQNDEATFKHNSFRCKGCGYTSLGIGALTVVNGIMILLMPGIATYLAFVYMLLLIIAFAVLMIVFK